MQKKTRILEIQQLVEWFKKGKKIKKNWRVGTEHEKFAYNFSNLKNSSILPEKMNVSPFERD